MIYKNTHISELMAKLLMLLLCMGAFSAIAQTVSQEPGVLTEQTVMIEGTSKEELEKQNTSLGKSFMKLVSQLGDAESYRQARQASDVLNSIEISTAVDKFQRAWDVPVWMDINFEHSTIWTKIFARPPASLAKPHDYQNHPIDKNVGYIKTAPAGHYIHSPYVYLSATVNHKIKSTVPTEKIKASLRSNSDDGTGTQFLKESQITRVDEILDKEIKGKTFANFSEVPVKERWEETLEIYKGNIPKEYSLHKSSDCNKLDEIYASVTPEYLQSISDDIKFENLKIISSCPLNTFGTDEEKAVLQLLTSVKDKPAFHTKLYNNPKIVKDLYSGIDNANNDELVKQVTEICQSYWNQNTTEVEKALLDVSKYFLALPKFRQHGTFEDESKIELWGSTPYGTGPAPDIELPKRQYYHPLAPVVIVYPLTGEERVVLPVPAIFIKDLGDDQDIDRIVQRLTILGNYFGIYGAVRGLSAKSASLLIRYLAITDLTLIAFQTCLDIPNVNKYIHSQPWGADFLYSYKIITLGMNITNFGIGLKLSFVNHADEVAAKLRAEDKIDEADELLRLKKSLQAGEVEDVVKVVTGAGSVFKVGDNIARFFVNRIKNGTNGKIAIVGRKMAPVETVGNSLVIEGKQIELFNTSFQKDNIFKIDGVDKTWGDITSDFNALKNQYGTIPDNILQNSLMYKANLVWAEKIKTQGYTIIDLGNPTNETAQSIFYNMEVQTIFP